MPWISLDELLEKIILKLYKQWERRLLSPVRPLLDDERLRLATALRTLASAHIAQSEDAIILFLERLGTLEAVVAGAPEEFAMLTELKQSILRARRPGMRLRGHKVKPTNLSPARMQTILAMLEVLDPPSYAVTRMYFPEDLVALSALLEAALRQVIAAWDSLALETRGAILRILHTVRVGLVQEEGRYLVTVRSVVETLHQFEAMPEVMLVSRDAFLAGKVDNAPESPFRFNAMAVITDGLANLIANPPPISAKAAGERPATSPDLAPAPDQPDQTPGGEPPVTEEPVSETPKQEPALPPGPVEPVQPSLMPARPPAAVVERDFYTDVRFPQQVRLGDEEALIVRLTRSPFAISRAKEQVTVAFGEPDEPEYVEVVAMAHGFVEGTSTWSRTMAVYADRDSQPVVFLLRAGGELGEQRITLDFYHKRRYLGTAAFVTRIVEQLPRTVGGVVVDRGALTARFVDQPPPPADLELRIVRGSQDNELQFMLHSSRAGVGYHWKPMGRVRLNSASPQGYLQGLFSRLGELAAQAVDQLREEDARVAIDDMTAIGQQLFQELFPPELQNEFFTRILPRRRDAAHPEGVIASLLITSDEPWIPWEMIKPYRTDPDSGLVQSAGFLAETFQVSRWLAGRSPAHEVHVKSAGFVAPEHQLLYAQREEAYFRQLPTRHIQVQGPLRTTALVRQLAQSGGVQLLHFAAHGRFDAENVNLSPLTLEDGKLTPYDLIGERAAGLRRERPLIFLNACHTARLAFALTGLGGWAERLVNDLGVSAFVGTLWEVNDLLAAEFAITFYDRLFAGDTLGQAFYAARLHVRDRQPANPTWLAYVLYGDPNSIVRWGDPDAIGGDDQPTVAEMPAPVEPATPQISSEDLAALIEAAMADALPELLRRSIPGLVDQVLRQAMGTDAADEQVHDAAEDAGAPAQGEPEATPRDASRSMDALLFLDALAMSDKPAPPNGTEEGHDAASSIDPQASTDEVDGDDKAAG